MIRYLVIAALVAIIGVMPALAAEQQSEEWQRGWCSGYETAVRILKQNRDRFRSLIGDAGTTVVGDTARMMLEGIDNYVVLSAIPAMPFIAPSVVNTKTVSVRLEDGTEINCP